MRKNKGSVLLVLSATILLCLSTPVFAQTFDRDLYFGMQGDSDVTKLQEFLTDQSVYSGPISGNFFSLTLKGVKQFQTNNGISPAAGYFGPITRAKVNAILSQQLQASNAQALAETSSTPPAPTPPATTNDINNSLQAQLNALLQQVSLLQKQLEAQQQTNQTLQKIQQNTSASPAPNPAPPPPAPPPIYIYITPPPPPNAPPTPSPTYSPPPPPQPPPPSPTPQPGSLTVTQNAAFGSQIVTKNSTHVRVGSYSFTASSASGVQVSAITITVGSSAGTNLQNLGVWANGTQFGSTQSVISNNGQYLFSGTPFTIAAGATQVVDVYADIQSSVSVMAPATILSGCAATGVSASNAINCSSVSGQGVTVAGPPALTVTADSATPASNFLVMGSTGNTLAAFRFSETSNNDNVKITDLNVTDQVSSIASVKSGFGNLSMYNGSSLLGTAGSAIVSGNTYVYQFHFGTAIVVPQANSITLTLKGDVSSYASSGATDNTQHTFAIVNSGDITALGNSSNATSSVTLTTPNGNQMTLLRTKLALTGTALGSATGRAKTTVDDFAALNFAADAAGAVQVSAVKITYSGSAPSGTQFFCMSCQVKLYDPANGISYSPAAVNPDAHTITYNLNYVISAGTSKSFNVRIDSTSPQTAAASNGVSQTLSATIAASGDVTWSDALDSAASTNLGLPASVIPIPLHSVSYAAGT